MVPTSQAVMMMVRGVDGEVMKMVVVVVVELVWMIMMMTTMMKL